MPCFSASSHEIHRSIYIFPSFLFRGKISPFSVDFVSQRTSPFAFHFSPNLRINVGNISERTEGMNRRKHTRKVSATNETSRKLYQTMQKRCDSSMTNSPSSPSPFRTFSTPICSQWTRLHLSRASL